MTKSRQILQIPARRAGAALPGTLIVGSAHLELGAERTPDGGTHSRTFAATWSKGKIGGEATIELRPTSRVTTEITVTLGRPKGILGVFWPAPARRSVAALFAQALAYEASTRHNEETTAFDVRRTTPELVRARSA